MSSRPNSVLFADLGPAAQRALDAVSTTRRFSSGQIVMLEGEPNAPVFIVREGALRVYRTSVDGREQTLIRLGPGSAFNMPAAFMDGAASPAGDAAPASAVTLVPAKLSVISRTDFCRTVIHTPDLALIVLRDLAIKVNHLTDLSRDLGLLTVRARLASFLLNHGHSNESSLSDGVQVRWTHAEIAAQIGTVREVVSRTMRAFVKDGLIKLERHQIVVLDRETLLLEAES